MICIGYFVRCLSGVCPPLAAKRRELQWNSSSAVPSKFSQPGVARSTCLTPVFVRPWRPNGVNLHLTVASRQMNVQPARSGPRHSPCPGVARDTHSAPKRNLLTAAHPGEQSQCFPASSGQPAAIRDTSQRPEKKSPHRSAPRGAKPVFARLQRPNGVNFNETAHLLFH